MQGGHNEQNDRKEYGVLVGKEVRYKSLPPPSPLHMGRAQNTVISVNVLETSLF